MIALEHQTAANTRTAAMASTKAARYTARSTAASRRHITRATSRGWSTAGPSSARRTRARRRRARPRSPAGARGAMRAAAARATGAAPGMDAQRDAIRGTRARRSSGVAGTTATSRRARATARRATGSTAGSTPAWSPCAGMESWTWGLGATAWTTSARRTGAWGGETRGPQGPSIARCTSAGWNTVPSLPLWAGTGVMIIGIVANRVARSTS